MTIHREGKGTLILGFVILGLINWAFYTYTTATMFIVFFIISVILYLFLISFFRSPNRNVVNNDDSSILSPCDGKVVVIEKVFEPEYIKEECWQVSVFMSPLNVHVNWFPSSGNVLYTKYHPGKYLVAWHPKASTENERTTICYESLGKKILLRQIAGALARRIVFYAKENHKYSQGEELGFIKFGSRVDIYLPLDVDIKVSLNDVVSGNRSVIAKSNG